MISIKPYYILLLLLLPTTTWAQLSIYPLERNPKQNTPSKESVARIQGTTPVSLPFWDDFSFATEGHAVDSLWCNFNTVLVSSGQGINPPTINVATFDGLNENGTAYSPSPSDINDYGYRDTLETQPIKMTEVSVALRNSVFLSFFYQAGGHGEPPDANDFLRLEFKTTTGIWETITTLRIAEAADPTVFYDTLIRINADKFYHDDFRFRFISFGRKSGRYDAWHIDYVYLNKGRDANDRSRPDRAVTSKLTTLFEGYYGIPKAHLNSSRIISAPQFNAYNLREGVATTTTYQITGTFRNYFGGVPTTSSTQIGPDFPGINGGTSSSFLALERKIVPLFYLPDPNDASQFDYTADSIKVMLSIKLLAGDVFQINPITGISTGVFSLDYNDPKVHTPIDFRANDTTSFTYWIKDFYSYDDGNAEYAAGLATAGNRLAYRFDMKTNSQDTINGLSIHYTFFPGIIASNMEFFILDHNNGLPGDLLYEQLIPVIPKTNNEFVTIELFEGVIVKDTFFIGYREPSPGHVRIGLDKSNDTASRMYDKVSSTWVQNDRFTGSLMIRPRFGTGDVTTSVTEVEPKISFYPNPNTGSFYIKGQLEHLHIINITGQSVDFQLEYFGEEKRVTVSNAPSGLYIVRYKSGTRIFTKKILISK